MKETLVKKWINTGYTMEAHHKKPFADYKELRFSVNNGITLCKECHKNVDIFRR